MSTTPYQFINRGNLFITPVGPSIAEVPYPTQQFTKPREFSLWVHGQIEEPAFQLDRVRMPPSLYQSVREDLVIYSPVEVSRSAFRRSDHAYVGVIDSKGKPYYFALDSRGISVREADIDDQRVWKTFDRLSDEERGMALRKRRVEAAKEMTNVDRELSRPQLIIKADGHTGTMVALHLPRAVAEQVAIPGGESPESMHITVVYLGKDLTEEQKSGALAAVRRISQKSGPIKAMLGGVGRFSASHTSEGKDVIYLSVDSPDLTRIRPQLLEELAAEGIVPSNAHGYVPHITLAYVATTARTPIKRFPPVAVEFPCLSLTVADEKMLLPFTTPLVIKALPKKTKEEKVKKTPNKKASSKKAGAGGKTRYNYPNEKKGGAGGKPAQPLPLVVVQHDDSKNANPSELANQLGISIRTLQRCAQRLGREGFSKFMRSHLKRFSAKHRLDPDYWGTLYARLVPGVG
jgi:2'-5' RNA ligase